jgi:hypothetical protein
VNKHLKSAVLVSAVWLAIFPGARGAMQDPLRIAEKPANAAFPFVKARQAATIYVDPRDAEVVHIAAEAFRQDVGAVTGVLPTLQTDRSALSGNVMIVGTLGQSAAVDQIARAGGLVVDRVRGKWESFTIAVVDRPLPKVDKALVIAGSGRSCTSPENQLSKGRPQSNIAASFLMTKIGA